MSTRERTDTSENVASNEMKEISSYPLVFLASNTAWPANRGKVSFPTANVSVNPTRRSAKAKVIRKKDVRFSLFR